MISFSQANIDKRFYIRTNNIQPKIIVNPKSTITLDLAREIPKAIREARGREAFKLKCEKNYNNRILGVDITLYNRYDIKKDIISEYIDTNGNGKLDTLRYYLKINGTNIIYNIPHSFLED